MRNKRQPGFTIVELLIVIVVIAILAVIAVVLYNGIQARAVKTSLQSDLRNAATKVDLFKAENGDYPTDEGQALSLFDHGEGTDYQYTSDGSVYSLTIRSNKAGIPAYCKLSTGTITEGPCSGHSGPVANGGQGSGVTTLAGNGSFGFADGVGANAEFNNMQGIAVDSSGVVYVADFENHRIRKIMPDGTVSTFAGNGNQGHVDGIATVAEFDLPKDLTIDSSGNVYVIDYGTHDVRKITPSGVVSTLAGSGTWDRGFADGTGSAARFNYPSGIVVDSQGYLFVADWNNQRIRKVSPTGVVTTFAGSSQWGNVDGTGTAARFSAPTDIAIDGADNLYVTETGPVRKITPTGVVTTLSNTSFTNSHGSAFTPRTIASDAAGNIYYEDLFMDDTPEDIERARIMRRSVSGVVTPVAGSTAGYAEGTSTAARFSNGIFGIAVSNSGTIYVSDGYNGRVRKIEQ